MKFCLALWFTCICFTVVVVHCIDEKCAACIAVAKEVELGLGSEKPKNHLDMRHRLDSKGQRRGKVIDYRVSELRAVELLDELCQKMQDYTPEMLNSTAEKWIKVDNWDNVKINKQEARAHSKGISSYCGRLLEETEEELTKLIMNGSVKRGNVENILCHDLSKHCKGKRNSDEGVNNKNEEL